MRTGIVRWWKEDGDRDASDEKCEKTIMKCEIDGGVGIAQVYNVV